MRISYLDGLENYTRLLAICTSDIGMTPVNCLNWRIKLGSQEVVDLNRKPPISNNLEIEPHSAVAVFAISGQPSARIGKSSSVHQPIYEFHLL